MKIKRPYFWAPITTFSSNKICDKQRRNNIAQLVILNINQNYTVFCILSFLLLWIFFSTSLKQKASIVDSSSGKVFLLVGFNQLMILDDEMDTSLNTSKEFKRRHKMTVKVRICYDWFWIFRLALMPEWQHSTTHQLTEKNNELQQALTII